MNFGNVRQGSIGSIYREMKSRFPSEDSCFINKNHRLLSRYGGKAFPIGKTDSMRLLDRVVFGPLSEFNRLHRGKQ
jgi:hypothetical protein